MDDLTVFEKFERWRYGPLGGAVTASVAAFGIAWTIFEASGSSGSPTYLLYLAGGSMVVFFLMYIALLHRRMHRIGKEAERGIPPDIRTRLAPILASLNEKEAAVVERTLQDYQDRILDLQHRLERPLPADPVLVEGGTATIGADGYETDEAPPRVVDIPSFLMDATPVTNQQFAAFLGAIPGEPWSQESFYRVYDIPYYLCHFQGNQPPVTKWDHPIIWVNWYAAAAYCNWRSAQEGRVQIYRFESPLQVEIDNTANGWRLPTEVEWEYAARGEEGSEYPWDGGMDPTKANYGQHYGDTTAVGRFPPNRWGVYDLIGNVKEWCQDWYSATLVEGHSDYTSHAPATGKRCFRGASWMDSSDALRVTRRGRLPPANTNPDCGFRCVRSV